MKKSIVILCALCSCTMMEPNLVYISQRADDSFPIETRSSTKIDVTDGFDFSVSLSEAESVAKRIESNQVLQEIIPYESDGYTLYYIANYDNGYRVISGDKRTSPFLLESDEGKFEYKKEDEFDGPSFWLRDLSSEILLLKRGEAYVEDNSNVLFWNAMTGQYDPVQHIPLMRSDLDSIDFDDPDHVWALVPVSNNTYYFNEETIPHILTTKWGQGYPWNHFVPKSGIDTTKYCPTGCSAVAMAQIIYYSHYNLNMPNWLYHDARTSGKAYDTGIDSTIFFPGTFVSNSTHWDDMAVDRSSYFVGGSADYVGQLMADVGHQIGMNYGPNGSGAYVTTSGFNHYGIYCNSSDYNSSTVISQLLSNKPVVVVAYTTEDGHTWVIDGLHSMVTEYVQTFEWRRLSELNSYNYPIHLYTDEQMAIIDPNVFSGKTVQEVTYYRQYFYKMNWGYDGRGDEVHYGVNDNVWTYVGTNGNYNYQFDKTIWYDFR